MNKSSCHTLISTLVLASSVGLSSLASSAATSSSIGSEAESVNEQALYDKAPAGSAFIRLINLQSDDQALKVNGLTLRSPGYCSAGSYQYLPSGQYTLEHEGQTLTVDLAEDLAYSLVLGDTELTLRNDPRSQDQRRGVVSVYNLSETDGLALKTSDGRLALFDKLQSGDIKSRAINPVRVDLSVFHGQARLIDTDTVIFERGVTSSLLICGDPQAPVATWVR